MIDNTAQILFKYEYITYNHSSIYYQKSFVNNKRGGKTSGTLMAFGYYTILDDFKQSSSSVIYINTRPSTYRYKR